MQHICKLALYLCTRFNNLIMFFMKKIIFNYSVIKYEECIFNGQFIAGISEAEIKDISETMVSTNGGFPCSMSSYEQLSDRLWNEAVEDYLHQFVDVNLEEIYLEIENDMPKELVEVVNPFITKRTVTVPYYVKLGEKESHSFVTMDINKQTYESMLQIAKSEHELTDFEQLRQDHSVLYHGIIYDMSYLLDDVTKESIDFVTLREFPHEIYENI